MEVLVPLLHDLAVIVIYLIPLASLLCSLPVSETSRSAHTHCVLYTTHVFSKALVGSIQVVKKSTVLYCETFNKTLLSY